MSLKLVVKSVADPTYSNEFVFAQDRITIGRDPGNLLALPDEKRILSKQHAEIRVSDDGAEVVDLGSKNYTYLNDERLPSRKPRPVRHGDVLRMGDFEVQVAMIEPEVAAPETPPEDDRTVFAFNPFWEPAERFRKVIEEVQRTYRKEPPGRRSEALTEAISDALDDELQDDVLAAVASALGGSSPEKAPPPPDPAPPPRSEKAVDATPESEAASKDEPEAEVPSYWQQLTSGRESAEPAEPAVASDERRELLPDDGGLTDMLLDHVADLLGIPWQFRHEFIGQTIVQSEASSVLYDGDAAALKSFLLDPAASDEERAEREQLVAEAAEALRVHQVALLDGYKASVEKGSQRFLDEVDLDKIRERVIREAQWYEKPIIWLRTLQALQEKVEELRREDWTVIERRVFRPAFIKAYLARMTSTPHR